MFRMEDLLDLLDTGIVVVGSDGVVQLANRAAARLLGVPVEELQGHPPAAWLAAAQAGDGEDLIAAPGNPTRRLRVRRRAAVASKPSLTVVWIDPAEPTPSEALARLRRLEGTLRELSVISHDINNPLTALLGRAQILKATANGDPRFEKASAVIEESASRIAGLARELSRTLREGRLEAADSIVAVEASAPR